MAKRSRARRSAKSSSKKRGGSCVKSSECGVVFARTVFTKAKGCDAKTKAAEFFRKAAGASFRSMSKAEKTKVFKEALRKAAAAARVCGNAEKAARIQAALSQRDSSESRMMDPAYTGGFEGWRRRASKGLRGRRRARSKRSW